MSTVPTPPQPGQSPSRFTRVNKDTLVDLAHVHAARWAGAQPTDQLVLYLDFPGPDGDYEITIRDFNESHEIERALLGPDGP